MVTKRKPIPPLTTSANAPSITSPTTNTANPPYPTSPPRSAVTTASSNSDSVYSADLAKSPAFDLIDMREAQQRARSNSDSSHGTWDSEDTLEDEGGAGRTGEEDFVEVPRPLNITPSKEKMKEQSVNGARDELPPSLRIGPAKPTVAAPAPAGHGYEEEAQGNPWSSEPTSTLPRSPGSNTKNPYLNLKQNGVVGDNINSQTVWQNTTPPPPIPASAPPPPPTNAPPPPPPPMAPVELPTVKSPSQELEQMELGQNRPTSWETAERFSVPQVGQQPLPPVVKPQEEERPVSTWWQDAQSELEGSQSAFAAPAVPPPAPPPKQPQQEEEQYQPPPGPPPGRLIDHDDAPSNSSTSKAPEARPDSPGTLLQKQRNPTYQIRHVNWLDESPSSNLGNNTSNGKSQSTLRNSPILTQNANGPCPLLALVNALVLSTPHDVSTSLTQILSDREQISLGLLLDAVFDELMSERRAGASGELPDVTELYSFLLALHTGMNVNPRFVTPAATPRGSWDGVPAQAKGMHPANKAQFKAGAFEETREMRLYSTFSIPLIHGWVAPVGTEAYEAFVRSAQTFEDAQNIQFAESELHDKKSSPEGLTREEEVLLADIKTIKTFLETWPTQLTDFGLETMSKSLLPGQIAILFRNDHFSTIYKEPRNGALMTLVTDTGYATHDEIVWESLVDVNGAASEMFSGDFRGVSHAEDVRLGTAAGVGGGAQASSPSSPPPPPLPGPRPTGHLGAAAAHATARDGDDVPVVQMTEEQRKAAEQEDHDLALALQLQEEEEDRQRQDEQRRRREQELSEQFLSNESSSEGPRPPIPPRRSGGRGANSVGTGVTANAPATTSNTRPNAAPSRPSVSIPVNLTLSSNTPTPASRMPVNRPADVADDPDAPPSYEQAASDRPYRPAGSTAAATLTQGNAIGAYDALRRQSSAYAQQSTASLPSFAEAGPASPPYTPATPSARPEGGRRLSRTGGSFGTGYNNQAGRRGSTQIGFSVPPQRGQLAPGHYPGSMQARSTERLQQWNSAQQRQQGAMAGGSGGGPQGPAGAPGVREAEDKCVVM